MTTQHISISEAVSEFRRLGLKLPRAVRSLARLVVIDTTREALSNVSNDLVSVRSGGFRRYLSEKLSRGNITEDAQGVEIGLPAGERAAVIGRVQDEGATIRPTVGQFLRVPLQPAQTANRVDRFAGTLFRNQRPTNPVLFFLMSKAGNALLVAKVGKRNPHIVPYYVLERIVTLKPRYWWRGAVKAAESRVNEHADQVIGKEL